MGLLASVLGDKDVIVSTTGMISRELFEYRTSKNQNHERDFLTVGSMGHASQIALGIAMEKHDRKVWCFDGDGAQHIPFLGGLKVVLGGSAESARTVRITFTNVQDGSLCIIAYRQFGAFTSQYGKAYLGVKTNNNAFSFSNFFTGSETSGFNLTPVEGSPNVFEGNMAQYSGINVFCWNCNATVV